MSNNAAFDLLQTMSVQSRFQASALPAQEQIHQVWKGVAFELLDLQMVSPMGQVTEIIPVPQITHIPRVKNWVQGLANVRGQLVPVIDLPVFLGQHEIPNIKTRRLMVVKLGDYIVGLIVNRVHGMKQITLDQFNNVLPSSTEESVKRFLAGQFETQEGEMLLFDMQKLLYSDAFVDVASQLSGK
jgi:twitching motility protein PilI